ncbi:patatin family protein [Acetobacterium wieringae]|uniref:patatin-like phospholipase family protein n=1 Tax=Acetobacterium wieringae TaxID=52694 RepID=UPI003158DCEC
MEENKTASKTIKSNIKDTALIFEGGGMRASYTAGFLNTLLKNQLHFDYVAGISAGSSHCVNYLSRDPERARRSFVEIAQDPNFGGWKSFIKGEGFFRSRYLYEETSLPGGTLPLDFDTFMTNPAQLRIGLFERRLGKVIYYRKEDITAMEDLMKIVRGSSSLPIFMPPTDYDGRSFVDGGLGGGIALDIAKQDGYQKYFVVLTREKGYRKSPLKFKHAIRAYYRNYPKVAQAMLNRHVIYNKTLDELEALERQGRAFLVYPETMPVSNREVSFDKLADSYQKGYAQGQRDLPKWLRFLGMA